MPVSRLDDAPSRAAVESANANVQMMTAALLPQGRPRGTFHPGRTHRGGRQPADAGLFLNDGKNGDEVPFRAQKYGSCDTADARTAAATAQWHHLRAYRPCGEHQRCGGRAHGSRLGLRPLRDEQPARDRRLPLGGDPRGAPGRVYGSVGEGKCGGRRGGVCDVCWEVDVRKS